MHYKTEITLNHAQLQNNDEVIKTDEPRDNYPNLFPELME